MKTKENDFRKELAELLKKYDANIEMDYDFYDNKILQFSLNGVSSDNLLSDGYVDIDYKDVLKSIV